MNAAELELAIRDSIAMEGAKTLRDLEYICRNIEARHEVDGISDADRIGYENVKRQHLIRVSGALVA